MSAAFKAFYVAGVAFKATQRVPIPMLGRVVELLTSSLATLFRCGSGAFCAKNLEKCKRPEKLLVLYEFEGCPFCRKAREALTVLDLDVEVRPCPKESMKMFGDCTDLSRFRPEVTKHGGKQSFPFLIDENTGVKMNESGDIVAYLWKTYGEGAEPPLSYRLGQKLEKTKLFMLPVLVRPLLEHGMLRIPSKAPEKPLELWGCEGSPFVRLVREALCALELKYVLRNVGHGSTAKRAEFTEKYGSKLSLPRKAAGAIQMPFLVDPNTGVEMLESADIVKYLYKTYQTGPMANDSWLDYGGPKKVADGGSAKKAD